MCRYDQVAAADHQAQLKQQEAQAAASALVRHTRAHASQRRSASARTAADPVLAMQRMSRALEVARARQQALRCGTPCCDVAALTACECDQEKLDFHGSANTSKFTICCTCTVNLHFMTRPAHV